MFDIDSVHAKRPMRLVQPDTLNTTDPTPTMIAAGIEAAKTEAEAKGLTPASIVTASTSP